MPDQIAAAGIDETPQEDEPPRLYAQRVARAKAEASAAPGRFTLAADTAVALGRRIMPKPDDPGQVRACLARLSGRRHTVFTAVVLIGPAGKRSERISATAVGFARLTAAQIEDYVESGEGIGKAGGYAIQGRAGAFVRLLNGSSSGVVGLPLFETAQLLRGQGWLRP